MRTAILFLTLFSSCIAPATPKHTETYYDRLERQQRKIDTLQSLLDSCGLHRTYQKDAYITLQREKYGE